MSGVKSENMAMSERMIASILRELLEDGFQANKIVFYDLHLDESFKPFFDSCVLWLEDEGLIRSAGFSRVLGGTGTLVNATLTSKGLALLGRDFAGDDNSRESSIEVVNDISEGSWARWKVGDLIGGILGGFTKSMGN